MDNLHTWVEVAFSVHGEPILEIKEILEKLIKSSLVQNQIIHSVFSLRNLIIKERPKNLIRQSYLFEKNKSTTSKIQK